MSVYDLTAGSRAPVTGQVAHGGAALIARPRSSLLHSPACRGIVPPVYFVYLLRCADGTLYTGVTNDLAARERAHNAGQGAKYTSGRRPVRVVYSEAHESRSAAQKREHQVKRWPRSRKEALLAGAPGLANAW